MTIIRNLRGSWPTWYVDLDDGRVLSIYIRHGVVDVGIARTQGGDWEAAGQVKAGPQFAGVTDALTALTVLRELGYHYVADTGDEDTDA